MLTPSLVFVEWVFYSLVTIGASLGLRRMWWLWVTWVGSAYAAWRMAKRSRGGLGEKSGGASGRAKGILSTSGA